MAATPRSLRGLLAVVLLVAGWLAGPAAAQDLQPVPPPGQRVTDQTGVLTAAQVQALADKLQALEQRSGAKLAVLLVATTQPEDIAAYAFRVADSWKIGRPGVGDGALLVVARNDRRTRLEVSRALEGALPDLAARRQVLDAMRPALQAGDFAGGLHLAIDAFAARVQAEGLPAPGRADGTPSTAERLGLGDLAVFTLVGAPILAVVMINLLGRRLGVLASGAGTSALGWFFTGSVGVALLVGVLGLVVALLSGAVGSASGGRRRGHGPVVWGPDVGWGSGGSWGGGWGGGGSSNDFSVGGGGDFGGGGASGDW